MAMPVRRTAKSPSGASSPTPSSIPAFLPRKDSNAGINARNGNVGPFDVAPALSASHASLITEQAKATLSPRPLSPVGHRLVHTSGNHQSSTHPLQSKVSSNDHVKDWAQTKTTVSSNATPPKSVSRTTSSSSDKASEKAFFRRILFQNLSASDPTPEITSDQDLDHELHLLLAYLLRETVLPWYSKLTPDRELLTQIVDIVSTIVRTLASRVVEANSEFGKLGPLHTFLSHDLPLIIRQHYIDFRIAQRKAGSAWAPLTASDLVTSSAPNETSSFSSATNSPDPDQGQFASELQELFEREIQVAPSLVARLYHSASPHPGIDAETLSLDGKIDFAYLRIAVLSLLGSLMPADEYAPEPERYIVRDVLVTVLRSALAKPTRPWFIVQSLNKVLDGLGWNDGLAIAAQRETGTVTSVATIIAQIPPLLIRLWTFLMISILPRLVRMYLDLFNVQRARKVRLTRQSGSSNYVNSISERGGSTLSNMSHSRSTGSLYERQMHGRFPSEKHRHTVFTEEDEAEAERLEQERQTQDQADRDVYGTSAPSYTSAWIQTLEEILDVSSSSLRSALFGFLKVGVGLSNFDHQLDHHITQTINRKLTDTRELARMVKQVRLILLPNGHLPPAVPDPSPETRAREWDRLRARLLQSNQGSGGGSGGRSLPTLLKNALLSGNNSEKQLKTVTHWLGPLCSPQADGPNTFLGIMIFERVLVMLCPDLVEQH